MELGRESEPVDLLDLGGGMAGLADGYQLLEHEKTLLGSIWLVLRTAMLPGAHDTNGSTLPGGPSKTSRRAKKERIKKAKAGYILIATQERKH
jgi:hypothetical protein